jgi:hypothetical protein
MSAAMAKSSLDNLSPYIDAAPREEQKYFLTWGCRMVFERLRPHGSLRLLARLPKIFAA